MPRKIGYGNFTPARKAALKKAQLESARKRRKHGSEQRSTRKRKLKQAAAVAVAAAAVGGAAYGAYAAGEKYKEKVANAKLQTSIKDKFEEIRSKENPVKFSSTDDKAVAEYGKRLTKQTRKEWSKTELGAQHFDSIRAYTSGMNDYDMNMMLRGIEIPGHQFSIDMEDADFLDSAFDSENVTPTTEWMQVTRGGSFADLNTDDPEFNALLKTFEKKRGNFTPEDIAEIEKTISGKDFTNKGFTSTSMDEKPAFEWGTIQIDYKLPPGTRALYLANDIRDNKGKKEDFLSDSPHEKELLLRRNLQYKITGVSLNAKGKVVFQAEVQ